METIEITSNQLIKGDCIKFETKDKENLRIAELSFSKKLGLFLIFFNGDLIHASKNITKIKNRLDILINKWNLEFLEIESE
jgi:hypothetical protein